MQGKLLSRFSMTLGVLASALLMSGSAEAQSNVTQQYLYTGSDTIFKVPDGVDNISVKLWGAGGGGFRTKYSGGGGGFVSGDLSVYSGEPLTLLVGGGNDTNEGGFGGGGEAFINYGGGGGLTSILNGSTELADAGGGGGAAFDGAGGAGGGLSGQAAIGLGGGGGTQVAGGSGEGGGSDGTMFQGGYGKGSGGGGGGGGYWGGGAGGPEAGSEGLQFGGGGGGSSYIGSLTDATTMGGNGGLVANSSDPDYVSGVGIGGANFNNGGDGEIVLSYTVSATTPEPGSLALLGGIATASISLLRRRRK